MKSAPGPLSRGVLFLILALLIPTGLAACGSDDADEAQELEFTISSEGKLTGPATADSGLAEISLQNDSDEEADLQLVRTEGDEMIDDAVEGAKSAMKGAPLPDWFLLAGGVGATPPGQDDSVEQILEPGTYFAFGTSAEPTAENAATVEVAGDSSDDTLETEGATVNAFDYNFETEGLTTGDNDILFENTGVQPHHVIYAPIKGDATLEDIKASIEDESGPPPIDEKAVKSTAILEGGDSQIAEFNFEKPGRYALICFISDREGGPPHAVKGMVAEVEVE